MKEVKIPFEGTWGNAVFSSAIKSGGGENYLTIQLGAALHFFRKISMLRPRLESNALGEYAFALAKDMDVVNFGSLTLPKHLLSGRKNGCTWNPKGKINFNQSALRMSPIQYQGEHCPDAFWGTCLERLMGVGRQVIDVKGTAESSAIFFELINRIYQGLGNSYYDLAAYGSHTAITISDTKSLYSMNTPQKEWEDYVDQQMAAEGIYTVIDGLKDEGIKNYDIPIFAGEATWTEYKGQMGGKDGLFERVIRSSTANMNGVINSNIPGAKPFFKVTVEQFNKYEDELLTTYTNIPDTFYYKLNGQFCKQFGCAEGSTLDGVLRYKGFWVIRNNEQAIFDNICGIKTHRCELITPGVKGIAYDVRPTQYEGLGLRLYQNLNPGPDAGKVFMDSFFKLGTSIVDVDFMSNASTTLFPQL